MLARTRTHPRPAEPSDARTAPERQWRAWLEVGLRRRAGRTRIGPLAHEGPLRIQRAFHPESDGTAHVVVLHPPAGCVGGDRLRVSASIDASASALLTTPGAGKIYRTNGFRASMSTELRVAEGATLEHVPQEMVVYEDADAALTTAVDLRPGARFLGWEVVCLGRPAANEGFETGSLWLDFTVRAEGAPIFVERGRVDGGSATLSSPWGLRGFAAFGTLVATVDDGSAALSDAREALAPFAEGAAAKAAATLLRTTHGALLVVRALGPDGTRVRHVLEAARHRVRDDWRRPRVDPGIWRS